MADIVGSLITATINSGKCAVCDKAFAGCHDRSPVARHLRLKHSIFTTKQDRTPSDEGSMTSGKRKHTQGHPIKSRKIEEVPSVVTRKEAPPHPCPLPTRALRKDKFLPGARDAEDSLTTLANMPSSLSSLVETNPRPRGAECSSNHPSADGPRRLTRPVLYSGTRRRHHAEPPAEFTNTVEQLSEFHPTTRVFTTRGSPTPLDQVQSFGTLSLLANVSPSSSIRASHANFTVASDRPGTKNEDELFGQCLEECIRACRVWTVVKSFEDTVQLAFQKFSQLRYSTIVHIVRAFLPQRSIQTAKIHVPENQNFKDPGLLGRHNRSDTFQRRFGPVLPGNPLAARTRPVSPMPGPSGVPPTHAVGIAAVEIDQMSALGRANPLLHEGLEGFNPEAVISDTSGDETEAMNAYLP